MKKLFTLAILLLPAYLFAQNPADAVCYFNSFTHAMWDHTPKKYQPVSRLDAFQGSAIITATSVTTVIVKPYKRTMYQITSVKEDAGAATPKTKTFTYEVTDPAGAQAKIVATQPAGKSTQSKLVVYTNMLNGVYKYQDSYEGNF